MTEGSPITRTTSRSRRRAATAERIVTAAREVFAEKGYRGATMREIGVRAGVDPSLIHQHYGTKQKLFSLATNLTSDATDDAGAYLADVLDLDRRELRPEARALLASMLTEPAAREHISALLQERIDLLAAASPATDAEFRAAVVVSSMLGLTLMQHFLKVPALEQADTEALTELVSGAWTATLLGSDSPHNRSTSDE